MKLRWEISHKYVAFSCFAFILFIAILITLIYLSPFYLNINYDKVPQNSVAQIYYDMGEGFKEHYHQEVSTNNNQAKIKLPFKIIWAKQMRIDPICTKKEIIIDSISTMYGEKQMLLFQGDKLRSMFSEALNVDRIDVKERKLIIVPKNDDPVLLMTNNALHEIQNNMITTAKRNLCSNFVITFGVVSIIFLFIYALWKNNSIKYSNILMYNYNVPFIIIFILLLIAHIGIVMSRDELWMAKLNVNSIHDGLMYLKERYFTWTPYLFSETVVLIAIKYNLIFWRICNASMFVLLGKSISFLFLDKTNKMVGNWIICGLLLLFPYSILGTAGWIATTAVYLWTYALAIFSLIPIKKAWLGC